MQQPSARFAKIVFIGAGVWGILVLSPLYFLVDLSGKHWAAPTSYPHFFYGFLSVAMAWQIAFLVIGSDPLRFRPLMIPAVIEKLGFNLTVLVLLGRGRIPTEDALVAIPDLLLAAFFIAAFVRTGTPRAAGQPLSSRAG